MDKIKNTDNVSAGKDVEQQEPADGNAKWFGYSGNFLKS